MREFIIPPEWRAEADTIANRFGVPVLKSSHDNLRMTTVWMADDFFQSGKPRELAEILLPKQIRQRLQKRHGVLPEVISRRVGSLVGERALARIALGRLTDKDERLPWQMYRTSLGRPLCRGTNKDQDATPYISFSHDGRLVVCVAVQGIQVVGVGVDVVHLPRVRKLSIERLDRFAEYFMSPAELMGFHARLPKKSNDEKYLRAAAHFSLMESASKALGTGLRMGGGMGGVRSLPRRTIEAWDVLEEPRITYLREAQRRVQDMRVRESLCEVAVSEELLLTVVICLKRSKPRTSS